MKFTAAALLFLSLAAWAEVDVMLVDGRVLHGAEIVSADRTSIQVRHRATDRTIATTDLVALVMHRGEDRVAGTYNLYLHNGDRVRGKVTGAGDALTLESEHLRGVRVPLKSVRAVRYGRIVALHLQDKYASAFERALAAGRDTVIALRDKFPTPIRARVLSADAKAVTARIGAAKQELPADKVYGFVLAREDDETEDESIRMRVHLFGGGRITLPFSAIDAKTVQGGGASIMRSRIRRIEFLGGHIANLSEFDPIDVKQTALFGKPAKWRRDAMVLGGPLRMRGRTYARGIGVASYSKIEYVLGGRWDQFFVRCGIDDVAGPEGDAIFRVIGDGKVLREVRCRAQERPVALRLDVTGVDRLALEVVPGDSYISDFCDWAEARVFKKSAR